VDKRDYKVLLVLISKSFGGAEVRVLTQARALQDRTGGATIATIRGSMLHQRLEGDDLPYVVLESGRGSLGMLFELRKIMAEGGYHVMDAHNVQSILWGAWAAALAGVPRRVATVHSDFAAEYPGMKGRAYAGVLTATRPVIGHTITVTEVLQQQAEAAGRGANSTLIPNAVPIPDTPLASRRHDLAAEWGFAPDDLVVGIVGRLVPVKGHRTLFEALAQLGDVPKVKLAVVGTGVLEDELKALAAELGIADRVHFTGFRKDIPDIMQNLDVLCMASLSEALPYVILEASSYARALLTTEVGGLKTLLDHDETALLVPPEDPDTMAVALRRLATDPDLVRRLGLAAYEMVRAKFSLDVMMGQILTVYDG
jgi:glycosyltransferase involved in cell wall biosynthesis